MTDFNQSDWRENDVDNVGVSPNGVQSGYNPNQIAPIIRAIRGGIKRDYVRRNPAYITTGTGASFVLTYEVAPVSYTKGDTYRFWAHVTNTGAATININGLGAKTIVSQHGSALTASQIPVLRPIEIVFDGTNFVLVSNESHDAKFTGILSLTGSEMINSNGSTLAIQRNNANAIDIEAFQTANNAVKHSIDLNRYGGAVTINGNTAWHAGNDGSGSGLDAGLLEGQNGAYYRNGSNINAGTVADARLPTSMAGKTFSSLSIVSIGTATSAQDYFQLKPTDYGAGKPLFFMKKDAAANEWGMGLWDGVGTTGTLNIGASAVALTGSISATTATFTGNQIEIQGTSPRIKLSDTNPTADDFWMYADQTDFYILTDRADDGTWETPHPLQLRNATNDGVLYGNQIWTTGNFDPNTKANLSGATFTGNVIVPTLDCTGQAIVRGNDLNILNNGNKHLWFKNASGTARAILYNDTADNSLRMNLYNSSGTYVRGATFRESDGQFLLSGGYFESNGNMKFTGGATVFTDGNIYMTWAGAYLSDVLNSKITTEGRSYPRRIGGVDLNFNWSGQSGQPSWLWGGNDGSNMYVYNPSNFNVNYAGSAGNADTVDGYHATDLAQLYKGTGTGDTSFPLGHSVLVLTSTSGVFDRNGAYAVHLYTGDNQFYVASFTGGAGTALTGTWRARGKIHGESSNKYYLMQRVA